MVLTNLNETFFDVLFSVNIRRLNLHYGDKKIGLRVERRNEAMISAIFNAQQVVACLNKTVQQSSHRFGLKWNSPYSIFMGNGREKSVFNTNYTEMINQHETDLIAYDSISIDLGLESGFSSHFRDDLNEWFAGQTYPFSYFQMDLEYYFFLANLSKN